MDEQLHGREQDYRGAGLRKWEKKTRPLLDQCSWRVPRSILLRSNNESVRIIENSDVIKYAVLQANIVLLHKKF
jgi:hypothetical protein